MSAIRLIYILLIHLFSFEAAFANPQSIDDLWKARGVKATLRLKELSKKLISGTKLSSLERCEERLEFAYAAHADSKNKKKFYKETKKVKVFYLGFLGSEPLKGQMSIVGIVYEKGIDKPDALTIDKLAEGSTWLTKFDNRHFALGVDGCLFLIDPKAIHSIAVENAWILNSREGM